MDFFETVPLTPPDPIFGVAAKFKADRREQKVDLTIGIYQSPQGRNETLDVVRETDIGMATHEPNKVYLPMSGDPVYRELSKKLVFGDNRNDERIFVTQTVGGTGALRVGAEFLSEYSTKTVYLPNPTWANHKSIFLHSGYELAYYPYFKDNQVDFIDMLDALREAPARSVVLLHAACHNPTGCDLTPEQWGEVSEVIKKRELIPFFDFAYQGFGKDIDSDAYAIRLFEANGHEMLVASSYSKSFGLYGERVGCLFAVSSHPKEVGSTIMAQIRANYSNPPRHGAITVAHILHSPELTKRWHEELYHMRDRLKALRSELTNKLSEKIPERDWSYLERQQGMFSLSGLTEAQVKHLAEDKGIYMTKNGRMNISGLNQKNLDYVADSFAEVIYSTS
ncbi:MAG: Aromatic-amino-acid aminotransferase [Chlamydiia bacterium]|nr:Aromatic-amino-acid aminotransferase [Chlamydiia bacterium]MCH9616338.1 Aromatic-amino-acid aminotransferase [Chlamydiia bacterium]MCH9629676.1 Aromatic-amino-acid aminotransferase [Chlamydiia bacterium]